MCKKTVWGTVVEALRHYPPCGRKFRLKLTPHSARGRLMPGVDLTDRDSLHDIMDELC